MEAAIEEATSVVRPLSSVIRQRRCEGVYAERGLGWGVVPARDLEQAPKGIWWMPRHQEAMKDVARCEKLRGDASDR